MKSTWTSALKEDSGTDPEALELAFGGLLRTSVHLRNVTVREELAERQRLRIP